MRRGSLDKGGGGSEEDRCASEGLRWVWGGSQGLGGGIRMGSEGAGGRGVGWGGNGGLGGLGRKWGAGGAVEDLGDIGWA